MPTFDDGESGSSVRTKINNAITAIDGIGDSSNVTITGGTITGITDLAVADGGTGASDASTARTNLGVAIGSDVQAFDAGLASIAGLTTAADQMIYATGSDVYTTTALTPFARTILDDIDASTVRTTLGLGTIAIQNANSVDIDGGTIDGTTIGGTTPAAGTFATFTSTGIDDNATSTAITIDASEQVGLGGAPAYPLHVITTGQTNLGIKGGNTSDTSIFFGDTDSNSIGRITYSHSDDSMKFLTGLTERMRIDSSGNVGIGETSPSNPLDVKTTGSVTVANFETDGNATVTIQRTGASPSTSTLKATTGGKFVFDTTTSYEWQIGASAQMTMDSSGNTTPGGDGTQDLGGASKRWQDIYATNGTIQTSDANEKQQVEELSEVERRVAMASKGLLRKFKWNDAVEAKGESARWHFGIIAQELQAAFEAEGLDAGDYGLFINSEWWTAEVVTPAVEAKEAELDEEGNVIVPAVEAQPETARTETYDSAEEAPEDAEHHSRMGVRYAELMAFIIAAM